MWLWNEAKRECKLKILKEVWKNFDIVFVDQGINEFHAIDPSGERFRYPTSRFQVEPSHAARYPLGISFDLLLSNMEHIYSVLNWIDGHLIERYGENQEWEQNQEVK